MKKIRIFVSFLQNILLHFLVADIARIVTWYQKITCRVVIERDGWISLITDTHAFSMDRFNYSIDHPGFTIRIHSRNRHLHADAFASLLAAFRFNIELDHFFNYKFPKYILIQGKNGEPAFLKYDFLKGFQLVETATRADIFGDFYRKNRAPANHLYDVFVPISVKQLVKTAS